MDNAKNTGASKSAKENAEELDAQLKAKLGVTSDQMSELLKAVTEASATVSTQIGRQAAVDYLAKAQPEVEGRTEEIAKKAVAEALARKQKTTMFKQHGQTALVSALVFLTGTAAAFGINKYRHRNDDHANKMNPQYQGSTA